MSSVSLFFVAAIIFLFAGCTCSPSPHLLPNFKTDLSSQAPSSEIGEYISKLSPNMLADSENLLNYVSSPAFEPVDCEGLVREGYQHLFSVNPDYFDQNILRTHSRQIVENFFKARVILRRKLGEWHNQNQLSESCTLSLRTGMRAIRVLEDFVMQFALKYPNRDLKDKIPALAMPDYLLLNPDLRSPLELKSGDVLLSRGTAVTSAAIARITEVDANFSHLAMVYVPSSEQKKPYAHQKIFVVEAHIEIGSVVSPLEDYLNDGKVRVVVYRQPDTQLAHHAAQYIYEKVKARQLKDKNIEYDFAMDLNESQRLFCSEVVSHAYNAVSAEKFFMPFFASKLDYQNADLLQRLGVTARETFAPADIELDPRFEMLAEWRDIGRIHSVITMDAVLTALFEWMGKHNYRIREPTQTELLSRAVWLGRRFPLFSGLLKDKFPKNMQRKTLATVMVLDKVGAHLYDHLNQSNQKYLQKTEHNMTPRLMLEELERLRQADLKIYRSTGQAPIHSLLRPD